jgi:hypothetical protein
MEIMKQSYGTCVYYLQLCSSCRQLSKRHGNYSMSSTAAWLKCVVLAGHAVAGPHPNTSSLPGGHSELLLQVLLRQQLSLLQHSCWRAPSYLIRRFKTSRTGLNHTYIRFVINQRLRRNIRI